MTKLWLDLEGNLIPVADDLSHEQWANQHGYELEDLLAKGWVRIVCVIPPLFYLDFDLSLTASQAMALAVLFENRFEKVVVQFRNEVREFIDNDEALSHALGRK